MSVGWRDGAWDRCRIGSIDLPGRCRITVTQEREVEEVKSPGTDGPELKDKGLSAARITVECSVWQERGRDALVRQLASAIGELTPKSPGSFSQPQPIESVATTIAGIPLVYVIGYTIPPVEEGVLTVQIECIAWSPSKPKQTQQGSAPRQDLEVGAVPPADPVNLAGDLA